MPENGRDATLVCIELHGRPREIVFLAGVLGLNADEVRVALRCSLPVAGASVVTPARRNHVERAVTSQTELRERTRKVWTTVHDRPETRHVAMLRACGVMAQHAADFTDVAAAAV